MTSSVAPPFRLTATSRDVLNVLRALPDGEWTYANGAAIDLALPRTSVSAILFRLDHVGWCQARTESLEEAAAARPRPRNTRRVYYRLTEKGRDGVAALKEWLDKA